ncbi:MAG: YqaJ viral recombinase family protein [Opitutae bacterium]
MLTEAQLKERATYIGSSDAKTIAGGDIAEWMTLMRQKAGEERAKFSKQTQFLMDTGSYLEPYIIDKWAEAEKRQVNFRGGGKTIIRNGVPLHSTFDGRVVGDNAPLEIKAHFGFKDMDELADFYAPQCQHHMLVSGADRCYLVALFGVRCRMEWRMLTLDQSWASMYLDNCVNFWNMYQNGIEADPMMMPPADQSDMYVIKDMRELDGFTGADESDFNMYAFDISSAKAAATLSDDAKDAFKAKMPKGCRRMDYPCSGNMEGYKVSVTRSRSGTMTCRLIEPKEDNDG